MFPLVHRQAAQQQSDRHLQDVPADGKMQKRDFPMWHCTSAMSLISVNDMYVRSSICAALNTTSLGMCFSNGSGT